MSISDRITELTNARDNIRTALANKGVANTSSAGFSSFASMIDGITTGGGSSTGEGGFQLAKVTEFVDKMPTQITVTLNSGTTEQGSAFNGTYTITSATSGETDGNRIYYCSSTNKYLFSNQKYWSSMGSTSGWYWIVASTVQQTSNSPSSPYLYTSKNTKNLPYQGTLPSQSSGSSSNGWLGYLGTGSYFYPSVTTTWDALSDLTLKGTTVKSIDFSMNEFTFDSTENSYTDYDVSPKLKNIYLVNTDDNSLFGNPISVAGFDYICNISNVTYNDSYKEYAKQINGCYYTTGEKENSHLVYFNEAGTGKLSWVSNVSNPGYHYQYKTSSGSWTVYYYQLRASTSDDITSGNAYSVVSSSSYPTYGTIETVKYLGKAKIAPSITGNSNGKWSIDGGTTWHGVGEFEIGYINVQYTMTFKDIDGYNTPSSQSTRLTSSGWTPSAAYSAKVSATLTVNISGATAGTWSIDNGTTWNSSGTTVSGYYVGSTLTVTFSDVDGYITPGSQTVTLSSATNTVSATYESTEGKVRAIRFAYTTTTTYDGDYYPTSETIIYNSTACTVYKRTDAAYYLVKFSGNSGWGIILASNYSSKSYSTPSSAKIYSTSSTCDAVATPTASQLTSMTWYDMSYGASRNSYITWSDVWGEDIWSSQGGSDEGDSGETESKTGIKVSGLTGTSGLLLNGDYYPTEYTCGGHTVLKSDSGNYYIGCTDSGEWVFSTQYNNSDPSTSLGYGYIYATVDTTPTASQLNASTDSDQGGVGWVWMSSTVSGQPTFTDISGHSASSVAYLEITKASTSTTVNDVYVGKYYLSSGNQDDATGVWKHATSEYYIKRVDGRSILPVGYHFLFF